MFLEQGLIHTKIRLYLIEYFNKFEAKNKLKHQNSSKILTNENEQRSNNKKH